MFIIRQTGYVKTRTGIASAATALAANEGRIGLILQNLGQNPLFVKFGSGASTSSFDVVLKAGSANDDGTGGSYSTDVLCPTTIVTTAGTSPRYTATEFSEA